MDDDALLKIQLNSLVEETTSTTVGGVLDVPETRSIHTYELTNDFDGFFSLSNGRTRMDIPKDMHIFEAVNEGSVLDVSLHDYELSQAFVEFFGGKGVFRLVKTTTKYYLVQSVHILDEKKAA